MEEKKGGHEDMKCLSRHRVRFKFKFIEKAKTAKFEANIINCINQKVTSKKGE